MICGLARAARRLARPDYAEAATRALDFIRAELWQDGRLKAAHKDGRARFAAYLDDYALLAAGVLELLQCRWRDGDLDLACALADVLLARFEDERGGFFFTANDHEPLIHKPKPFADEALPAGNGVAANVLVTLGHLLGEQRYLDAAERTVRAALHSLERYAEGHPTLLVRRRAARAAADRRRARAAYRVRRVAAACNATYDMRRLTFTIPTEPPTSAACLRRGHRAQRTRGTAYVCEGLTLPLRRSTPPKRSPPRSPQPPTPDRRRSRRRGGRRASFPRPCEHMDVRTEPQGWRLGVSREGCRRPRVCATVDDASRSGTSRLSTPCTARQRERRSPRRLSSCS